MFLGKHTLDETRDLLAVADYRFAETDKAYDALVNKPIDLTNDWLALKSQWEKDRKEIAAQLTARAIQSFPSPASIITTEEQYDRILHYIQFQEWNPKSLQGITYRIEQLRGSMILYPNQPKAGTKDVDLELFKELDSAIRAGEQGAEQAKKQAEKTADSHWPWIVGGTALGTVLLMGYLRK